MGTHLLCMSLVRVCGRDQILPELCCEVQTMTSHFTVEEIGRWPVGTVTYTGLELELGLSGGCCLEIFLPLHSWSVLHVSPVVSPRAVLHHGFLPEVQRGCCFLSWVFQMSWNSNFNMVLLWMYVPSSLIMNGDPHSRDTVPLDLVWTRGYLMA